jgi:hypothetical protein
MTNWTKARLAEAVHNYTDVSPDLQEKIRKALENRWSYADYQEQVKFLTAALENNRRQQELLHRSRQYFPVVTKSSDSTPRESTLSSCAILIMAGGEGERLRESLKSKGYNENDLCDFTKATFPLPGTDKNMGTLAINLSMIAEISPRIPVVVTTGPAHSTTHRVIPRMIARHNNFGLEYIQILPQNERLHLTAEKKIAWKETPDGIALITNPDETGGPLMKLKEKSPQGETYLEELRKKGAEHIIVLQGTAVYKTDLLLKIAAAGKKHDVTGIGIQRNTYPLSDPYGTFVLTEDETSGRTLKIVEKNIADDTTRSLKNSEGNHLPFNTGFYVCAAEVLQNSTLPPFAVPDKEVLPGIRKSPKTGYAATAIVEMSEDCGVITIPSEDYGVIKTVRDLADIGKKLENFKIT